MSHFNYWLENAPTESLDEFLPDADENQSKAIINQLHERALDEKDMAENAAYDEIAQNV